MGSNMRNVAKTAAIPLPTTATLHRELQTKKEEPKADVTVFATERSPHTLLQEELNRNPWAIIVCCIMLNCTTRKQMEAPMWEFFERWASPEAFVLADDEEVAELIKSLGFKNRRTQRLKRFTQEFLAWTKAGRKEDVRTLHGVGEYAARAYEIFCLGLVGETEPEDGVLGNYWKWLRNTYM